MKKGTMVLLLALCLALATQPAMAAMAMGGFTTAQALPGSSDQLRAVSVQAEGDTFYITVENSEQGQRELYSWKLGDADAALVMAGTPDYPLPEGRNASQWMQYFFRDGAMYGLNPDAGVALKLGVQDGKTVAEEVIPLDYEDLTYTETYEGREYTYTKQLSGWQCIGGRLYVTMEDWNSGDGAPHLYSFNLDSGEKTAYASEFIRQFTAYRDGKLLCLVSDPNTAYDSEKQEYRPLTLSVFDPETDTLTPLTEIPGFSPYDISAMSYDAQSDTLYFITPEKIFRMAAMGAPELSAYVPVSYYQNYNGSAMARVGDQVMVLGDTGVYLRQADPEKLPDAALTIYGGYASDAHNRAIALMGDMPVTFYDKTYYSSAQELGQALVSGENQIDILAISMSYMDFERLMEKGYCYDLSGSEKLSSYVSSLYPFLQEGVMQEGKLFAVPVEMSVNSMGYTRYLEETGLTAPKTFLELCDFVQAWGDEEYYDTFSDYTPLSEPEFKKNLAAMAFSMYADYVAATGQELTLDSPILREVLAAAQALDVSDWEMQIDYETATQEDWDEFYSKRELLTSYADLNVRYEGSDPWQIAAPISLTGDTPLCLGAQVRVFFVNPRSQYLDAAIQYLEAYVESISAIERAAMCPEMNDPIENEYYQKGLAEYDKQIETLQASLATAKEADQPALEEQLQSVQQWRAEYEAENRYSATAESIAAYRALDPYFFLQKPNVLNSSSSQEFLTLFSRYLEGQISLEQFINEGDAKLRLMRLENQ